MNKYSGIDLHSNNYVVAVIDDAVPGSPALEITRRYVDQQGVTFQVTVSVYPAERFIYGLKLRRQPGAYRLP
jgi:DNA-binding GntR family transcriptional regulator